MEIMAKLVKQKFLKNRDFWLVVVILVFGFYTGFFKDLFLSSSLGYLEIDYGKEKRVFRGELPWQMSVLDALLASSRGGNFDVRYAILNDQTDILKVNGLAEDGLNEESWHFYLNGQRVETGQIHKTKIKPGDKILVKFE